MLDASARYANALAESAAVCSRDIGEGADPVVAIVTMIASQQVALAELIARWCAVLPSTLAGSSRRGVETDEP